MFASKALPVFVVVVPLGLLLLVFSVRKMWKATPTGGYQRRQSDLFVGVCGAVLGLLLAFVSSLAPFQQYSAQNNFVLPEGLSTAAAWASGLAVIVLLIVAGICFSLHWLTATLLLFGLACTAASSWSYAQYLQNPAASVTDKDWLPHNVYGLLTNATFIGAAILLITAGIAALNGRRRKRGRTPEEAE